MNCIRKAGLLVFALVMVSAISGKAEHERVSLQLGLVPSCQLADRDTDLYGFRLNLWGENENVSGVDVGFGNLTLGNFNGFGLGGYNYVGKNCTGLQLGLVNVTENLTGVQVGLVNVTKDQCNDLQFGFINKAGEANGMQFGLLNRAEKLDGFQLGLFNCTDENNFLQFGLFNHAVVNTAPQVGLVNVATSNYDYQFGILNFADCIGGWQFGLFNVNYNENADNRNMLFVNGTF